MDYSDFTSNMGLESENTVSNGLCIVTTGAGGVDSMSGTGNQIYVPVP